MEGVSDRDTVAVLVTFLLPAVAAITVAVDGDVAGGVDLTTILGESVQKDELED